MATIDVVDLNNQKVGQLDLADDVFGAEVNEALLYEAVRQYQAGHRAGTHSLWVPAFQRSTPEPRTTWKLINA